MKNLLKLRNIFTLVICASLFTCSTDDNNDGNDPVLGCDQLVSLSVSYSNAVTAFQSNPSEGTCNEMKTTALNFIDGLDNCAAYAEQYGDLEEAAQELSDMDCSQFSG